ncbi:MAG: hypothetical protein SFT94_08285 [Pseudanabaenaceae cyanobacterium bins.68]|nr:hypothetical protein [Pseudanabaenaceae cyanobacterium bins.68]
MSKFVPDLDKIQQQIVPKLDQALQATQKNLAAADAWAITKANQVIEQGAEQLTNLTQEVQSSEKITEEITAKVTKQVGAKLNQGRDRLIDLAKNTWNKIAQS